MSRKFGGPTGKVFGSGTEKGRHLLQILQGNIRDGTLFIFIDRLFTDTQVASYVVQGEMVPEPKLADAVTSNIDRITFFI